MSVLKDNWLKTYPLGSFPIHTLDAAKDALPRLMENYRAARDREDKAFFLEGLNKLYARWPQLRGGKDSIRV